MISSWGNTTESIPNQELEESTVFYIPHHAVFHNNKIRVVFNASMRAYNGRSLNYCIHIGAKLQQDIVKVLCRWRCYHFVFICDIVKIFRQIVFDARYWDWFRILDDFGTRLGVQHFRLCTVTSPHVRPSNPCMCSSFYLNSWNNLVPTRPGNNSWR